MKPRLQKAYIRCVSGLLFLNLTLAAGWSYGLPVSGGEEALGVSWDGFSYRVNVATGAATQLSRPDEFFNAMARNSAGEFFASDNFNAIYAIDPVSGAAALVTGIAGLGDSQSIRGMAFTANDRLLAVASTPFGVSIDLLYELDLTTGQGTLIGSTGLEGLQSLAIAGSGVVYSFDLDDRGLVTIDPATGATVDVSTVNGTQGATIQSLALDRRGALYGIGQSAIYLVNRKTGVLTELADFTLDVRGIEFAVPEPGAGWLMAAVAAMGAIARRRIVCHCGPLAGR
jgi:hypothetical protein